jgi:hypothetical protein
LITEKVSLASLMAVERVDSPFRSSMGARALQDVVDRLELLFAYLAGRTLDRKSGN